MDRVANPEEPMPEVRWVKQLARCPRDSMLRAETSPTPGLSPEHPGTGERKQTERSPPDRRQMTRLTTLNRGAQCLRSPVT